MKKVKYRRCHSWWSCKTAYRGPARAHWSRRNLCPDHRVRICSPLASLHFKDQRAASKVLEWSAGSTGWRESGIYRKSVARCTSGKIVSCSGFLPVASCFDEYNWDLNYGETQIFRAGCIIRAQFLQKITDAYTSERHCAISLAPYFKQIVDDHQQALRDVVAYAVQNGIPYRRSRRNCLLRQLPFRKFCQHPIQVSVINFAHPISVPTREASFPYWVVRLIEISM